MYLVGWLGFPTLEKWPFVGDALYVPAAYSPLVTRAICSRVPFYLGCMDPSVVVGWPLVGVAGPWSALLLGPALCRGCQPLVGRTRSQGCWLLVGRAEF